MPKVMLVNVVNNEESRIAIVADGRLEELSIETAQQEQIEGNIYKARIVKVIASLGAVFVDYGRERNGFLAAPDIHPQYFRGEKRDVDALRKGQDLLVQVKKGEIGTKGAALTTYVSLPGRHFVLMPHVSKRGVSRKIDDDATRKQLRKILDDSGIPEEMGYIARTAAEGRTKQELTRDAAYLLRLWKTIQARYEKAKTPALLYEETDIVIRTLRDYFTPSIEEVLIDDEDIYHQVETFFQAVMPAHKKRLKLHQAQAPLFSKFNLEDQIASIYDKRVPLPSGGSLVIEQTEALVSIDVNSGKTTSGKDIEETALIANREAAEEAARQLRLRDMGGLIVIDFIDMRPAKNRSEVRKVLQKALKEDKARTDTGTISKFGLLELSRQRIKGIARASASQACPGCSGLGRVRTPESSALSVLRRVQLRLPRKGNVRQVLVGVPGPVATLLQNRHRTKLLDLESRFGTEVLVFSEEALAANQFYLEYRIGERSEVETDLPEGFNRARLLAPQGLPELRQRPRRPAPYPLLDEEPETIEVPAEPETGDDGEPEAAPTAPAATAEEGSPEPGRKRRRRRRRGRGNRSEAGEDTAAGGGEKEGGPAADPGRAAAEAAASEADAEALDLAADSEPHPISASAKRRQRRKRATARSRTEEAHEGEAVEAAAAPATAAPVPATPPEQAASRGEEQQDTEAPKRTRRSRRRKHGSGAEAVEEVAATPTDESGDETAGAPPAGEPETETEQPRRPRRRRTRRPAAAAKGAEDAATPAADGAPTVDTAPSAESPPVPAPAAEPAPAEKPKRARRARKPKATEAASSAAAAVPAPADAGEPPAADSPEKPPAKARRPRKKAAAADSEAADAAPSKDTVSAKSKRTKPPVAAAETAETTPAKGGKKPAKRVSRTRKAAADPAAAKAAEADPDARPKAPRRRNSPKTKTSGDAPAEGGTGTSTG